MTCGDRAAGEPLSLYDTAIPVRAEKSISSRRSAGASSRSAEASASRSPFDELAHAVEGGPGPCQRHVGEAALFGPRRETLRKIEHRHAGEEQILRDTVVERTREPDARVP